MGYIASIDGLRAIAVMLVVFFHAGFSWMGGGFVGVDVFFVISGFLITGNIIQQKDNQTFSYLKFYKKRAARLLPALFVVITLSLIAAFFIISPADIERFGKSSLFASLSLSNIFFYIESGYFDSSSEYKPLLHTWSLAVEEQFYIFWPALLGVLYVMGGKKVTMWGVAVLSLGSLVASISLSKENPDSVFYLMQYRIYQFGIGALVALTALNKKQDKKSWVSFYGFAGIVLVATIVDAKSSILVTALLPAILTAVFIVGSESIRARLVFASAIPVWLGVRSYSIYLTHWPIMVFWKLATDMELSDTEKIVSVLLSIVSGALLHFMVEKRFRFNNIVTGVKQKRVLVLILLALVINLFSSSVYWLKGSELLGGPKDMQLYSKVWSDKWDERKSVLRNGECNLMFNQYESADYNRAACLKISDTEPNWLVFGDSYASGMYAMLERHYPGVNFLQMTIPGCALRERNTPVASNMCKELQVEIYDFIIKNKELDGVILSSNWDKHVNQQKKIIKHIKDAKKKVIVVNLRAAFKEKVPSILASSKSYSEALEKANELRKEKNWVLADKYKALSTDEVETIDMISLQCPDGVCEVLDENKNILYLDDRHFSKEGIDWLGEKLRNKYPNIFR